MARPLEHLASTAGRYEMLAASLKHHAVMCDFPNIKMGLERLAATETLQANQLRKILADHRTWPRMAETPLYEGASNWERLNADLSLLADICRSLNLLAVEWESLEPELAAQLRALAGTESDNLAMLRDLTLKCDPQALD